MNRTTGNHSRGDRLAGLEQRIMWREKINVYLKRFRWQTTAVDPPPLLYIVCMPILNSTAAAE